MQQGGGRDRGIPEALSRTRDRDQRRGSIGAGDETDPGGVVLELQQALVIPEQEPCGQR